MGYFGFAVYIDTEQKLEKRPAFVLFGEAVVSTRVDSDVVSPDDKIYLSEGLHMLKGVWCKNDLPIDDMRLFYWEIFEGATGIGSIPLRDILRLRLDDKDEYEMFDERKAVLLTNFHYFAEFKESLSDRYPLWLDFGHRNVWRVQSGLVLKKEEPVSGYDGYQIGVHQSTLGSSTSLITREFFYLKGEASFTKEWVESRWKQMQMIGVNSIEHQVNALISVFTSHVNFWVNYTRDAFKIKDETFSFELFSNRTMLVQSGDCEDVAAWLMSALNRVKVRGWCGGCMNDHIAINVLLKVNTGSVEGHKADRVFHSDDEGKAKEEMEDRKGGNFHVTCFVVHESALKARIENSKDSTSDMEGLLAEGTGLIFPVISAHVDGLEDHKKLLEIAKAKNLKDMVTFAGVSNAYEGAPDIYHSVFEIMINPELADFRKSRYKSTIYVTCYEKEEFGFSYPITFDDFMSKNPKRRVYLKPLMTIEEDDIQKYKKIAYFEPPLIEFDGVPKGELKNIVEPENVGFVSSNDEVEGVDFGSGFKLVVASL